jgi:hypothetical protein
MMLLKELAFTSIFIYLRIIMKTIIATIATIAALSSNFASAAQPLEAPEFRSAQSTLSRDTVRSAIMGAASVSEATIIPAGKSTLSRSEVAMQAKDFAKMGSKGWNELAASGLN